MAIYLKGDKPKDLFDLLSKLFSIEFQIGTYKYLKAVETYNDENCTTIQCDRNKYRSFDDVLEIVNTYFPEIKIEELIIFLLSKKIKDNYNLLLTSCGSMHRTRLLYMTSKPYPNNYGQSESPFTVPKYNSKYSWGELLNMIGITNQQEFLDYINKTELI